MSGYVCYLVAPLSPRSAGKSLFLSPLSSVSTEHRIQTFAVDELSFSVTYSEFKWISSANRNDFLPVATDAVRADSENSLKEDSLKFYTNFSQCDCAFLSGNETCLCVAAP